MNNINFLELYKQYCETDKESHLNELLYYLQQLAKRISVKYSKNKTIRKFIYTEAMYNYFMAIINKKILLDDESKIGSYLWMIGRRAVSKVANDNKPKEFDILYTEYDYPAVRMQSQYDVEKRLDYEKLPNILYKSVIDSIRFSGNEELACFYLLNAMINGLPISYQFVQNSYKVNRDKIEFFVDYLKTKIHIALRCIYATDFSGRIHDYDGIDVYIEHFDSGLSCV